MIMENKKKNDKKMDAAQKKATKRFITYGKIWENVNKKDKKCESRQILALRNCY